MYESGTVCNIILYYQVEWKLFSFVHCYCQTDVRDQSMVSAQKIMVLFYFLRYQYVEYITKNIYENRKIEKNKKHNFWTEFWFEVSYVEHFTVLYYWKYYIDWFWSETKQKRKKRFNFNFFIIKKKEKIAWDFILDIIRSWKTIVETYILEILLKKLRCHSECRYALV